MATKFRNDPEHGPSYEEDFAAWAYYQAMLVRANRLHLLDRHWIAEELDSLGRGEYRTLKSALVPVLQHMLKWDHQPGLRSNSWVKSIRLDRSIISEQLEENPSLQPRRDEAVVAAYAKAIDEPEADTKLPLKTFPTYRPYSWEDITTRVFDWPEGLPRD